jgi:hypothetical protein
MGRAYSSDGEGRDVYRVLVEKPEGKRSLGRPRFRREDNIKMNLQEVGYLAHLVVLHFITRTMVGKECRIAEYYNSKYSNSRKSTMQIRRIFCKML